MTNSDLPIRAGVFEDEPAADRAVTGLLTAGFHKDRISVVTSRSFPDHPAHGDVESVDPAGSHTRGAVAFGGAIGSVLGGLTAAAGVVATGGVGLLIVGPLIVGAATGGVAGGFVGAMMSRGFEPEIADYYDQALQNGQFLVAVEASDEGPPLDTADAVFESSGAVSIPMHKG
jgi:outer membrane lipoprotein SlyB